MQGLYFVYFYDVLYLHFFFRIMRHVHVNFVLWRGVQKYFLYAQMLIQCVECAFTVIYLLLVSRNL